MRDSEGVPASVTFPVQLDDDWVWIEVQVVYADNGGESRFVNVLVRNVTAETEERQRRQREKDAAETSEAILKNVVNSLFGYILTIDVETPRYSEGERAQALESIVLSGNVLKELVARMGGSLKLESAVGKGSVFTISIPAPIAKEGDALSAHNPAEGEEKEPNVLAVAAEAKVLIVDDSPVNLKVLAALLARLGCVNVLQADNGRQALEMLHRNAVDLVLTDMWMPEMDGGELIKQIRRRPDLRTLPVYAVTADVETVKTSGAQGFSGVLLKPLTLKVVSTLFAG